MLRVFAQTGVILATTFSLAASSLAHSTGETGDIAITPPQALEMRSVVGLGPSGSGVRSVINGFKLWNASSTISACFFDGDEPLKEFFVVTSKVWTTGTSLQIDFGPAPQYTVCDPQKPSNIRISFSQPGNWSY